MKKSRLEDKIYRDNILYVCSICNNESDDVICYRCKTDTERGFCLSYFSGHSKDGQLQSIGLFHARYMDPEFNASDYALCGVTPETSNIKWFSDYRDKEEITCKACASIVEVLLKKRENSKSKNVLKIGGKK